MADISKIKLPSGNEYDIKDAVAREAIAGGVSFIIAWDGTSTPVVADIPYGVVVTYNSTDYTGTLSAETTGSGTHAQAGAFYLVKSSTQAGVKDVYDEYVPVGTTGSKTWEKLGDTTIDLTDVVTGVSLSKSTDTVVGTDATFTITQPTVALSTGATAGTGVISVATGITSASATGGGATWNSKDQKTVVTSYPGVTGSAASSVTPTTKKLATTTVTGVSGSTTPNVVQTRTSQTTADGTSTASTTNTDWLKGVSVSDEVLTFGAATLDTQTTYSADAPSSITIPTAASSATTVATGSTTTTGSGADVVTDVAVGDTVTVLTGLGTPETTNVIGASSTFTNTQPTITVTPTTTNIKATASGANTAWNSKDSVTVLTNATDVSVTKGS